MTWVETSGRLAEMLAAISLASDRARGQPPEAGIGAAIVATRLARAVGVQAEDLPVTFYLAVTRTLGCSSTAMDVAPLALGDDRSFSLAVHLADPADPASVRCELEAHLAPDADPAARRQAIDGIVGLHPQFATMSAPTGQQAVSLSRRLPVPAAVPSLLGHLGARWEVDDPSHPAGEDVPLAARIVELATVAELFRRAGGLDAVADMAAARRGTQFDPRLCDVLRAAAAELFAGFDAPSLWPLFLDAEPEPVALLGPDDRRVVAAVGADYTDNKSGWFVGNSRRVALVAAAAGEGLGLDAADCDELAIAGLLHDLGRCALPNGILDKAGPLTEPERRVVDAQGVHTAEILAASAPLRPVAELAASARERADGSGHPRGVKVRDVRMAVLAAADMLVALRSPRPWRPALAAEAAAEVLAGEVAGGRLDPDAVSAVLATSVPSRTRVDRPRPDGLTDREVEVLALLASGKLTKQIAGELGIAYKTADNHVQNLYRKIGAATRTAAAMYAVEHGIYEP